MKFVHAQEVKLKVGVGAKTANSPTGKGIILDNVDGLNLVLWVDDGIQDYRMDGELLLFVENDGSLIERVFRRLINLLNS